jgi:hypothetical protein
MSMGEARRKELEFFRGSKDYAGVRTVGTGYLSSTLSERLINAVRRQLPNISTFVNKRYAVLAAVGAACALGRQ